MLFYFIKIVEIKFGKIEAKKGVPSLTQIFEGSDQRNGGWNTSADILFFLEEFILFSIKNI